MESGKEIQNGLYHALEHLPEERADLLPESFLWLFCLHLRSIDFLVSFRLHLLSNLFLLSPAVSSKSHRLNVKLFFPVTAVMLLAFLRSGSSCFREGDCD